MSFRLFLNSFLFNLWVSSSTFLELICTTFRVESHNDDISNNGANSGAMNACLKSQAKRISSGMS
jgi:hypothetical protein